MSFADAKPRAAAAAAAPRQRQQRPPPQALSANEVALLEEEEQATATAAQRQGMGEELVQVRERTGASREQAHERFLRQYATDATQVAEVFAELGQHLEQQQDSLDKVEDNTLKAVDALREGITEYADGAKQKAKYDARKKTLVAGVVGGATAVAAIATGGIALGIAAGAAAVVGGMGAQAECRLVTDAAQGEVETMEVQQALGPLKDKKDWSPDAEARECQYCSREFTVYWRRHHCRSCGGIFCANCAPKKAIRLCNTCTAKKAQATGRKVKTSGTSSPSQAEEDDGLMGQWAADAPVATPRSRGSKELGAADTVSDRAALLGAGKPALGKGVSAAEAEALRAAERAAAAGAAAASKVADQGEQIHGVAGSANTAAEFAARAERVDQCYSTFGAIKMAWSRGATLVTGESSADHEPEPEPEPEPPQGTVLAKAMYFRVVQRVRLDPCFEPPRSFSGGTGESGRWLEEGASIQVVESKWIGEQVCRMRLLEGGWVTAIDNDEKFLRRDRARTQASGDDDAVMQKLAQLTTQNLQTGLNINAALTKQAEEIEQIDASVTKAAESTDKLNASAAKKLGGLGKAPKRGSASTRSV